MNIIIQEHLFSFIYICEMKTSAITLVNEVSAKQRVKPGITTKAKQQVLSLKIFCPIVTKFKRERIVT